MKTPFFLTFEGLDCSGKSTIINKLNEYLLEKNIPTIMTREPGGKDSLFAEKIRNIILDNNVQIDSNTEALLFATSRSFHVRNVILPNLRNGINVICDRYIDSSLVYQGYAKGLGIKKVININKYAINDCWPNFTIYLKIDIKTYNSRIGNREQLDRLDIHSNNLKEQIIEGYDKLSKKFKKRYIVIDANKQIDEVFNDVIRVLKKKGII